MGTRRKAGVLSDLREGRSETVNGRERKARMVGRRRGCWKVVG